MLTPITEESFHNLSVPAIPGFSDIVCNRFYEAEKDLLIEAQRHEVGTEVVKICSLDGQVVDTVVGVAGKSKATIQSKDFDHFVFHNHPSNGTLTEADIETFIMTDTAVGIAAIGNNGSSFFSIMKTAQYDGMEFYTALRSLEDELEQFVRVGDVNGYLKAIDRFLEGANKYGVIYTRR